MRGHWRYLEHDWIAKPGTFIYEPAGEAHTLVITEDTLITLEQSGAIRVTPPARYCYVVARFVLLEDVRRERMRVRVDAPQRLDVPSEWRRGLPERETGLALREQRLDCLDCCLQKLQPEQRELVVEYYRDALRQKIDRRRHMAKRLGITMNALAIRAWRIRTALECCVEACRTASARIADPDRA